MDMEGLSTICAGLGSVDEDDDGNRIGYSREEYCSDNLKDLLRFLRRDDFFTRDVFKQVCKWNIVAKDLVPIIEHCQDDRNLVLNAVKVLVFLTMPLDFTSKDINEQLDYLWGIKSAITFSNVIIFIVSLLEKPLENLECETFSEDDWKLVQLVLTLFRNILAVQDISVQQKALGSANQLLFLRDDFLEKLFRENVMDLIIIITQHVGGSCHFLRRDNLLLLEIYHYVFTGQDPELIAKAGLDKSKVGGNTKACLESLKSIAQEEAEKRKLARMLASRHSQFNGTFTRRTLDGSKTMCKGTLVSASCDKLLKPEKVHRGPSKRVVKDYIRLPTTKKTILELLQGFLDQFLTGGYNVLMQSIAEDIEKEHHSIQNSDVFLFFQLSQFITSFQYHKSLLTKLNAEAHHESSVCVDDDDDDDNSTWFKGNICGPIAAAMNESMFQLVVTKWHLAFEGLKETKNNAFLSVAGSLMKVMIRMLDLVLKLMPENSKEPQTARAILYKLFYDQTDQGLTQFLFNMLRSFDPHKQPKSDLADLVEIVHVVIRLMEKLQAHGTLRVSRKTRRVRKKKATDLENTENAAVGDDVNAKDEILHPGNEEPPRHVSTNEKETSRLKDCSAKEENVNVATQVDEIEASTVKCQDSSGSHPHGEGEPDQIHDNLITREDDCDLSGDEQLTATHEVDFKITSLLLSLATSNIISNICWLLKFYKSNSPSTNHYVLCLLRRVTDDLDLAPMLYQLSCLVIFYDILNEQKTSSPKEYEDIVQFLNALVRRMLRKMKSQPLLFVDVLFWKTRKDCHYINIESIQREVGEMQKEVRNWGFDGEAGLSRGTGSTHKSLADALGDDEYDIIVHNEAHLDENKDFDEAAGDELFQTGHEDSSIEKLSLKGDSESTVKKKRRLILNDKLEVKIRGFYEMYKNNLNCCQLIAEALDPDGNISSAQVSRKCKKLRLQVPLKNSIRQAHSSHDNGQYKEGTTESDGDLLESNHPNGPSFMRKPMKRVRALDENLELKIRNLFEQFKGHKRCSHMIAKELDPNGGVTAAQVSRKLKKLGLHTSQMKTVANMHVMDEVDAPTDDSDNLTLSLLRKRGKDEDASLSIRELVNAADVESLGHSSDDELLSFVMKKSRKDHTKGQDKDTSTSMKQAVATQHHELQIDHGSGNREERSDTELGNMPIGSFEDEGAGTSGLSEKSPLSNQQNHEASANSLNDSLDSGSPDRDDIANTSGEQRDLTLFSNYNDLEDSGDEQMLSASPKSSAKRRKLRVVMAFEDEEE